MVREPAPPAPKRPPACEQGPALRKLIAAVERDGRRKPKKAAEGRALIEAGKALCIAKCGGCELTGNRDATVKLPRRDCRARVRDEVAVLEAEISSADHTERMTNALDRARRERIVACRLCGRCKMSRAPITPLAALRSRS